MIAVTFLAAMIYPAVDYAIENPMSRRRPWAWPIAGVSAIPFGLSMMLLLTLRYAVLACRPKDLVLAALIVGGLALAFWMHMPSFKGLGYANIAIFLVGVVAVCLVAGVPIAFCFGIGTLCFLTFSTSVPLMVMIGRMDEGMSSLILLSVPVFVLLGCILDAHRHGRGDCRFSRLADGAYPRRHVLCFCWGRCSLVSGISAPKCQIWRRWRRPFSRK